MIRLVTPDDTEALIALADAVGLFSADELVELQHMLVESCGNGSDQSAFWLTDDQGGDLISLAYCEPERMTSGTWNLQLIAVHPDHQRQGRGAALLQAVEQTLTQRDARLLLVETMGTPDFEPVRAFYRHSGYSQEACIREFYAAGADKIVFCKALSR